jgi:hypothetical protein
MAKTTSNPIREQAGIALAALDAAIKAGEAREHVPGVTLYRPYVKGLKGIRADLEARVEMLAAEFDRQDSAKAEEGASG